MKQLLTCILNDKAGTRSGGDVRALIAQRAAERGWEARFQEIPENGDLRTTAEEACGAGGIVVAGGGDGTISAVASALVDTDVVLGVLPLGTLNHFAKDMGIPLVLEKALETLFTGVTRRVDIGEVNGRVFLNNSSIGFYPRVVKERERDQRRGYGKWVAFVRAVTRIARQPRTLRLEMGKESYARKLVTA